MGSAKTHKKHTDLKSKINEILWDGTFYKSIHGEELLENPSFEKLPDCQNVKELMGYVPWIYGIAPEGRDKAFEQLKTPDCFLQRAFCFLINKLLFCLWHRAIIEA